MDRPEIISELTTFVKIEEKAIALYSKYQDIRASLPDLKEADRNRMDAIFATLLKDSQRHKTTFSNLLDRAQKNEQHVHDDEL